MTAAERDQGVTDVDPVRLREALRRNIRGSSGKHRAARPPRFPPRRVERERVDLEAMAVRCATRGDRKGAGDAAGLAKWYEQHEAKRPALAIVLLPR